jgi:hypothetical protein
VQLVVKVTLGQIFCEYFGFPYQLSFQTHLSSGAGTISRIVTDVPSGLSLTSRNLKKNVFVCNTESGNMTRVLSAAYDNTRPCSYASTFSVMTHSSRSDTSTRVETGIDFAQNLYYKTRKSFSCGINALLSNTSLATIRRNAPPLSSGSNSC